MSAALIRMAGVFLLACGVMAIWGGGDAAWPDSALWLFPGLVAYMMGDFYGQLVLRRKFDWIEKARVDDYAYLNDRINALRVDTSTLASRVRENEGRLHAPDPERDAILAMTAGCGPITASVCVPKPVYINSVVEMILNLMGMTIRRTAASVTLEYVEPPTKPGKKVRRG